MVKTIKMDHFGRNLTNQTHKKKYNLKNIIFFKVLLKLQRNGQNNKK